MDIFTTSQICELCGVTPRSLQLMIQAGAITADVNKGAKGRGKARKFSVMQALGVCYAQAFIDAGCHHSWAYEAAKWVASQKIGPLAMNSLAIIRAALT